MKIERNIPIPARAGGRDLAFPWPSMGIGDSITIAAGERSRIKALRSWSRWADRNKVTDRKITTRAINGGRKIGVWIVAKGGRNG